MTKHSQTLQPHLHGHTVVSALDTVRTEREAVQALEDALSAPPLRDAFCRLVANVMEARGRMVVTGVGKSGLVARKIASTLRSTGTPATFLHAGEASHGDLGMIEAGDVVLALSRSGETGELAEIVARCRFLGTTLAVATCAPASTAGRAADICLPLPAVREACPNQLAPTASTIVQAVLGDALAIALMRERGFGDSDFHRLHPGGQLGARLATVGQLMGSGEQVPVVPGRATLLEATVEMSRKRYGCTAVVDEAGWLIGVFTDGDLRRSFASGQMDRPVIEHMTPNPLSISADTRAAEALRTMNEHAVSVLFVCDAGALIGVIHFHDVVRAGIV
ncbi:KpsF/GutQ family sugar-phosphate isomerase [Sphingomonas bacterium]|uniref:KpsF/GutQ family sugar-phosphate isomerase n=1 Tax=Sphingomonas bacterium TaxID=1895847 RepID=UPI0015761CA8|nr:KpsF/GutQ family sugar-phosphate isomerase [Sphingomonas bacterium]